MKRIMDGMFDLTAKHGPITGSGPNFESAMDKFRARQEALGQVGVWHKKNAVYKQHKGTFRDPVWYIVQWC